MNPIEQIKKLPDWKWARHSQEQIEMVNADEILDESDFVYQVGRIAVAGFIHHSFTSPPWMWFVLTENITISDLLDFRRLTKEFIPRGTLTSVDSDNSIAIKFAKFYGFEDIAEEFEYHGRLYRTMRKK